MQKIQTYCAEYEYMNISALPNYQACYRPGLWSTLKTKGGFLFSAKLMSRDRLLASAFFWITNSQAEQISLAVVDFTHFKLNYKQSSGTNLISCGWLHTFQKKAPAKNRSRDILHWMEIRLKGRKYAITMHTHVCIGI